MNRLRSIGGVKQIFLFGSFVTGKASPNDIDLLVVMSGTFSTVNLRVQDLDIFQHDLCRIKFHADLFWVTEVSERIESKTCWMSFPATGAIVKLSVKKN